MTGPPSGGRVAGSGLLQQKPQDYSDCLFNHQGENTEEQNDLIAPAINLNLKI